MDPGRIDALICLCERERDEQREKGTGNEDRSRTFSWPTHAGHVYTSTNLLVGVNVRSLYFLMALHLHHKTISNCSVKYVSAARKKKQTTIYTITKRVYNYILPLGVPSKNETCIWSARRGATAAPRP